MRNMTRGVMRRSTSRSWLQVQTKATLGFLESILKRRWPPYLLIAAMLSVVSGATVSTASVAIRGAVAGASAATIDLPPASLPGHWLTVANGDRVQAVLREDDTVWASTEGGGVVRWILSTGSYRQYLAPQDGLASNDVRQLLRARDGTLWAATADGLARLDPERDRWSVIRPDRPDLPSSSVTALAQGPDGSLWVGFEQRWDPSAPSPGVGEPGAFVGGGLARYDTRGAWRDVVHAQVIDDPDQRPQALPSENVTSIAFGSDGLLWVGTRPFEHWSEDACANPPCPPDEAAYVKTGGGLAATADLSAGWRHWNTLTDICPASTDIVTALRSDVEGRMWVATRGRGLELYRGGLSTVNCKPETGFTHFRPRRGGLPGPQVWGLDIDEDGRVWMTVGDGKKGLGVAVLDHNDTFDHPPGEEDDTWLHIGLDGFTDRIDAVATGIDEFDGEAVVGTRDDRSGDGWGVKRLDKVGTWHTYATADTGLPSNQITTIAVHPSRSEVWFGTRNRGAARWSGTTWTTYRAFPTESAVGQIAQRSLRASETVTLTMSIDAFNEAFPPGTMRLARLGTDPVLYEFEAPRSVGEQTRVDVRPPLQETFPPGSLVQPVGRGIAGDRVTAIVFDRAGRVWLGSTRSVVRPAPPHSPSNRCETSPDCWRDGGVSVLDDEGWTVHNPKPSEYQLPVRSVLALAEDSAGRIWAGTGVPTEDRGDGVAIFDPRTEEWEFKNRRSEGAEFGGDVVAGLALDPMSGDMWLATHHTLCEGGSVEGVCDENNRMGGGVSRWNGSNWTKWVKAEDSALTANGTDGNFASLIFDSTRGQVWVGTWTEGPGGLHWMEGRGIDAAANRCGRNCSDQAWTSWVFGDEGVVRSLAVDAEGRIWVGSSRDNLGDMPAPGGVKIYDERMAPGGEGDGAGGPYAGWSWLSTDAMSPEVTAVARQGDGMWVGTFDGGASRWWPVELSPGAYLPALGR
jgi:ligand-binding sensor domain-containing protein